MRPFLTRWLVTTLAVAAAVSFTGMEADGWFPLIATALILGIVNAFIRPVLLLLSLPFILFSLGLFILVVNAVMLMISGGLVQGFHVGGFGNAFIGSIIISIASWGLSAVFKGSDGEYHVITHHSDVRRGMKQVEGRVLDSDPKA